MPPTPALVVFAILAATILLFVSERLRLDVVALLALLALTLTGILAPEEALAGFADPIVLMIAGLFVVGDGLFQTGVARAMGRLPAKLAGDSEVRLLVVIMILVALLSGVMSSTGTVAVMLPVVVGLAWGRNLSPSKLLIPLSVASLLGGMLTLIGTAPNIVVSQHLESLGREGFGMFTFTPVGIAMVVAGVTFMALVGRRFLPDRPSPARPAPTDALTLSELAGEWALAPTLFRVRVEPGSPLEGTTLRDAELPARFGVTVTEIREGPTAERRRRPRRGPALPGGAGSAASPRGVKRDAPAPGGAAGPAPGGGAPGDGPPGDGGPDPAVEPAAIPALAETPLRPGLELILQGSPDGVHRMVARMGVRLLDEGVEGDPTAPETGMAEVLLTPRSRLLGQTLKEVRFRDRYQLGVVGIKRMGELVTPTGEDPVLGDVTLRFGDTLLVQGPWEKVRHLERERRDFIVAMAPREMSDALAPLGRAPVAVGIMVGMMVLLTLGLVPAVTAVLLAAVAMVLAGCVTVEDAYRSVNWESVVLIAGILPMATALEKTGGMAWLVEVLSGALDGAGPLLLLAAVFILTSALSQVISNTATAVLLAPIASSLALGIGARPEPFLMALAVAASTAFATPVASPVNTLVLGPGGYRFGDFFKVGVLLQGVILVVTLLLVPLLFPF
jgi:di/tricarboxylate transporter